MRRTWNRLKFIVSFVTCMENTPWVVHWYGDGCDCVMKGPKMCMMSRGATTQNLITTFGWEQFDHPPYSPDLAPSDFHLFLHLKPFLAGRQFHDDNKVKEAVTTSGGIILRWRDTKMGATLWQVPQKWWKLCGKIVYDMYIKWQYAWFVIYSCFF